MSRAQVRLTKDDRAPTVYQDSMFCMPLHGPCQHDTFNVASNCGVFCGAHPVIHPRNVLLDDRPLVEIFRYVMGGGTDQLHPSVVSLAVRLCTLEAREK